MNLSDNEEEHFLAPEGAKRAGEEFELRPTETEPQTSKNLETLDDALPYVGDFGRYQIFLLIAMLPYSLAYGSLYFSQFFFTLTPREHWCRIDELVNVYPAELRIEAAIPRSDEYPYYDTCNRKDLNYSALVASSESHNYIIPTDWKTNKTVKCERWEYNFTQIPYASMGVELDWVCERSYLVSTSQAIFFCGAIVGSFLSSWIADNRGRIPALMICACFALSGSIATAFTNSFLTFVTSRFFSGLAFDNILNIPMIIVLEYMAVRRRSLVVNVAFGVYFAVGTTMLPWIAYYLADWRKLCYVTSLPFLICLLTPWILPESARWYISNRVFDKVIEKLKKIAKINKVESDPQFYETFYKNLGTTEHRVESTSIVDLFRTPRLARRTIILMLFWALTIVAFDSHVYYLKLLPGSVFFSFSLACATELPAGILLTFLLDRWGRKFCGFITLLSTAIFSSTSIFLNYETGKLAMSVSSRFALNMAANVLMQYAAELLPTPVRSQGVSLIHMCGILAHSIAPFIVDSARWWTRLPMLIITLVSLIGATSVLFLPETLGYPMPQTLKEGEDFGKDQKFWYLPCLQGKSRNVGDSNRNNKQRKAELIN